MISLRTIGKIHIVSFDNNNKLHMFYDFLDALLFVARLRMEGWQ